MKRIPDYSKCCGRPVLAHDHRLYCHGCGKTVRSFRGKLRDKAMAQAVAIRSRCRVEVVVLGRCIAYARDVPNLVPSEFDAGYRKVGKSTYTWFIQGSSLAQALGYEQCKSRDGFKSLRAAWRSLAKELGIPAEA